MQQTLCVVMSWEKWPYLHVCRHLAALSAPDHHFYAQFSAFRTSGRKCPIRWEQVPVKPTIGRTTQFGEHHTITILNLTDTDPGRSLFSADPSVRCSPPSFLPLRRLRNFGSVEYQARYLRTICLSQEQYFRKGLEGKGRVRLTVPNQSMPPTFETFLNNGATYTVCTQESRPSTVAGRSPLTERRVSWLCNFFRFVTFSKSPLVPYF